MVRSEDGNQEVKLGTKDVNVEVVSDSIYNFSTVALKIIVLLFYNSDT
jgi:hypothetical protein